MPGKQRRGSKYTAKEGLPSADTHDLVTEENYRQLGMDSAAIGHWVRKPKDMGQGGPMHDETMAGRGGRGGGMQNMVFSTEMLKSFARANQLLKGGLKGNRRPGETLEEALIREYEELSNRNPSKPTQEERIAMLETNEGNVVEMPESQIPGKRKFKPWTPDSPYSAYDEGSSRDPNVEKFLKLLKEHEEKESAYDRAKKRNPSIDVEGEGPSKDFGGKRRRGSRHLEDALARHFPKGPDKAYEEQFPELSAEEIQDMRGRGPAKKGGKIKLDFSAANEALRQRQGENPEAHYDANHPSQKLLKQKVDFDINHKNTKATGKSSGKDPLKTGESFTTLHNYEARKREHDHLLREYGFPSEIDPAAGRYQRYAEVETDGKGVVMHNKPPWIVAENSEMIAEINDEDAPSYSKSPKATNREGKETMSLTKRLLKLYKQAPDTGIDSYASQKLLKQYVMAAQMMKDWNPFKGKKGDDSPEEGNPQFLDSHANRTSGGMMATQGLKDQYPDDAFLQGIPTAPTGKREGPVGRQTRDWSDTIYADVGDAVKEDWDDKGGWDDQIWGDSHPSHRREVERRSREAKKPFEEQTDDRGRLLSERHGEGSYYEEGRIGNTNRDREREEQKAREAYRQHPDRAKERKAKQTKDKYDKWMGERGGRSIVSGPEKMQKLYKTLDGMYDTMVSLAKNIDRRRNYK